MMTVEEMKNVDIRTVDPETLVDVSGEPSGKCRERLRENRRRN